jgi:hypothetical protein
LPEVLEPRGFLLLGRRSGNLKYRAKNRAWRSVSLEKSKIRAARRLSRKPASRRHFSSSPVAPPVSKTDHLPTVGRMI